MSKFRLLLMVIVLFCSQQVVFAETIVQENEISPGALFIDQKYYVVNGETRQMDVAPFLDTNGRALVPVRFLAYTLGISDAGITWNDQSKEVTLVRDGVTVALQVSDSALYINGTLAGYMDTLPVMKNNRVFLPARYIAEAFGHDVTWDGSWQKVMVGQKGSGKGLSLKQEPVIKGGSSVVGTGKLIATYDYSDGVLVGVQGSNWYITVSGGGARKLTVTDPNTGEKRTYSLSEDSWREDALIKTNNLESLISGIVDDLTRQAAIDAAAKAKAIADELNRQRQLIRPPVVQPPPSIPTVPIIPTIPTIPIVPKLPPTAPGIPKW